MPALPSSNQSVDDALLRIERAKMTVERLRTEIVTWCSQHSGELGVDCDHGGEGHVRLLARVKVSPPRAAWGLLIGDVLVDLRSALDYAVYALAVAYTGMNPPPSERSLQFPLLLDQTNFAGAARKSLKGLNKSAIDYIESLQPYQLGQGGGANALRMLTDLAGINKHRFVPVVAGFLKETSLELGGDNTTFENFTAYKIDHALQHGDLLAEFDMVAGRPGAIARVNPRLTVHWTFEPGPPGFGNEVCDTLLVMGGATEHVVSNLRNFI